MPAPHPFRFNLKSGKSNAKLPILFARRVCWILCLHNDATTFIGVQTKLAGFVLTKSCGNLFMSIKISHDDRLVVF